MPMTFGYQLPGANAGNLNATGKEVMGQPKFGTQQPSQVKINPQFHFEGDKFIVEQQNEHGQSTKISFATCKEGDGIFHKGDVSVEVDDNVAGDWFRSPLAFIASPGLRAHITNNDLQGKIQQALEVYREKIADKIVTFA